jgi:hypothetical protein
MNEDRPWEDFFLTIAAISSTKKSKQKKKSKAKIKRGELARDIVYMRTGPPGWRGDRRFLIGEGRE